MRLDWALLANAAEGPPNGLVHILGAGIDTLWREQFPAPFGGALVLRLLSSRIEADRGHKIEVHCVDEDGRPILNQPLVLNLPARSVPPEHPHGWDLASNIVVNLAGVAIPKVGLYSFEILIDNQQVRSLPFRAVLPTRRES